MDMSNNPTLDFSEVRTVNAKIKFSFLGYNEKDELIIRLGFECEGSKTFVTVPISYLRLTKILDVLELRSWEEIQRKFARIKINGNYVIAFGNLIEDKWFNVKEG